MVETMGFKSNAMTGQTPVLFERRKAGVDVATDAAKVAAGPFAIRLLLLLLVQQNT